ncbi:MAG: hypothetical protein DYH05_00330 [Acidobacteria bacterium ACB1]|nr:hypothetical protein [Acidobacteria bacterium ACB1]RIJ89331.1 MAG: hypothetical protein DCC44_12040 [Acidobacteriota bacterium]
MHSRFAVYGLLTAVFVLMLSVFSFGQDLDHVAVSGTVTDPNGLAVVGASVTIKEVTNGKELTTTTNDEGRYQFFALDPGRYKITATASGFGVTETPELPMIAGKRVQQDFKLALAGVAVETTVTADPESVLDVDTSRTIVGSTLTEREIEELPNNTRNPLDLVLAVGGTSEEALSTSDLAEDRNSNPRSTPLEQGNFTISGGASYSNNITIDGFDNNDDRSARDRFQPSIDAIGEVQVIRNQFSAEYGRASGGRVNMTTRGGTNKYRGRAYMTFKDARMNANSWYNNSRGYDRLPFSQYNPGFTFGGPLSIPKVYNGKNRTFFFVSYEYQNFQDTTFIDTFLPVIPNPHFNLPSPTGSTQYCDSSGSPAPPCPSGVGAVQGFSLLASTPNVGHIVTARFDHKLTKDNDLTFGWQFGRKTNRRTSGASTTRLEDALQAKNINTDAYNVRDIHRFGAHTVNDFGFQWSKYSPNYQTDNPTAPVVLVGYRNPITNSVQTLIAGNSTSSSNLYFSDARDETRYQFKDSITHIAGSHLMKFGFDAQHVNSRATNRGDVTGTYNFSNVNNYSNNVLSRYRQNFGTSSDVKNTYWALFFNDEVRLRDNLTMSFGLRYERETAVKDNNNFGPRFGVAWSPFKDGKGVIRFGSAIVYNRVLLRTVGDFIQNSGGSLVQFDSNTIPTTGNARNNILASIAQDFPTSYSSVESLRAAISRATCGSTSCSPDLGFLVNGGSSGNPLRSIDPNLKIPESYQFNVGFEREVAKGWVFEANYTWNRTAHLWREYNINAPVAPSGYADLAAWLVDHPFTFTNVNGTTRNYVFYLGSHTDPTGVSTSMSSQATCGTTVNVTCYVNLNTTSTSTTTPNTNAGNGVSSNSIGGPIGIALEAVRSLRPNPNFDEMERVSSIGKSFYQGLVLEFRGRYRQLGYGFAGSMRVAYTLSRLKDDGLNNTTNAQVNGDFADEWSRARQDRLHRITVSGTFQTPSWFGKLRFSPIFRFGTSAPFDLGTGVDRNLNDVSTDRPNFNGSLGDVRWREPGTPYPAALVSQFSLPTIGSRGGNLGRNAGTGPRLYIFDLSVSREWKFNDRFRLRPAVEFGNIFNMAVFSYGSEYIDFDQNPSATEQATFLVPSRTYRARDIRLTLRFDF